MSHAGAVYLGVDITDQVSLEVQILDERQGMVRGRARGVALEDLVRRVALQLAAQALAEQFPAHPVVQQGDAVKIGLHRISGKGLEGGLGPEHPRCPVRLGIEPAKESENGPAQLQRQSRTHTFLVHMPAVATVAAEILVASVTGQSN